MPNQRELNILQLYNKLATVGARLPDYDTYKKGFDMCLMLFKKGLYHCPSVNLLLELHKKNKQIQSLELKINDLTEDTRVLKRRIITAEEFLDSTAYSNFNDGFRKCEIQINDYNISLYIQISLEDFNNNFEEAAILSTSKRIRKNPEDTIRCRLMEFFRAKGFKCK